MTFELYLLAALVLDFLLGDPPWYPHPVRLIGKLAARGERASRKVVDNARIAGLVTCIGVLTLCTGSVFTVFLLLRDQYALQIVIAVILLYALVAIRDLLAHSRQVHNALQAGDREEARRQVARIVGRDVASLDAAGVTRACVETVAENMVDGITAPLFWAVVFSLGAPLFALPPAAMGAVGMLAYKCVNTMDSMFGYKNDRYLEFGWAAARLDDLVNMLPARLSGLCLILASQMPGYDGLNSWRIYRRDRLRHTSPNAAHPEAAVAGALGIRLGGPSSYFGTVAEKPYIGDARMAAAPKHILLTHRLVLTGAALFLFSMLAARNICIWLVHAL